MRRWWLWLVAFVPAALGGLAGVWLASGQAANPTLWVRGPLAAWLSWPGLGASVLLIGAVTAWAWLDSRHQREIGQIQGRAMADRRRFLRRLDHELKNPLTAIRAGLANAAEDPTPDAMQTVDAQVQRLSRLTTELRKLAELETRPLERSNVDLNELLTQVFELAQDGLGAESRRLSLVLPRAPWPLPHISGDRDLLLLALHNLLDNAIKFSRPNDTIELRASEDGAVAVVEVADTGPGIAEEDLSHVWEELYRGQGARGVPGSGLGLALVQAIVQRHGGQVSARSRLGQGTVFAVRLPIKG